MPYSKIIKTLISSGAHTAVKYLSHKEVIRATRKSYKKGKFSKDPIEVQITAGRPNYLERKFIKDCIKSGVKFPVSKIQLKFLPAKKKK